MTTQEVITLLLALIPAIAIIIFFINRLIFKKTNLTARFLARTGIFAALAIILYLVPYLKFKVPFFPSFLEIHFDEVPALIASFAYGPISGIFVIIIKTIVKLPLTSTMGVGELADFIYGVALVVPAGIVYKKMHNFKGVGIGLLSSMLIQIVSSMIFTTFVILPFYMNVMGLPEAVILKMCQDINPAITSLTWPFMFMVALPFNAFKDAMIIVITLLLYKRMHMFIDRISK